MRGRFNKTTSRLAIAAAAGLFMGGIANAGGSIGGDCCADLEESVAELEATTARKGNRKVSLTVYGQVNKAVLFVDDNNPATDSPRIIDNPLAHTGFGLEGSAKISSDLYAGYNIEFDVTTDVGSPLELTRNELYIGSKTFGKLSIGHGAMATDGIAEIDLSGTEIAGGSDNVPGVTNLDGDESERLRYDSPVLAGFRVSAAWTEAEDVDVALRYGAAFGDFTVAAGVGYQEIGAAEIVSGSVSALHTPTGLNLTFAAGNEEVAGDELDYFYVKGGIKRKVFGIGETAFSVDYHFEDEDGVEADKIGFQLVQNIDVAAMELYLSAWSLDSDVNTRDQDAIMIGSRIQF